MQDYSMYINGQAVSSDQTFEVINPATGESFARCAKATPAQVDQAVASAKAAFPAWAAKSDEERRDLCMQLAGAIEQNMPELMRLVTLENGKPQGGLGGVGAGMEVGGSMAWTQVTASLDLGVDIIQDNDEARIEVHRKPLGVVGSITPWNWPLLIAIWHIIPALRVGNTVVTKPSEYTPVATARFMELANEILPPGVLNMVMGSGEVGARLSEHPDIAKIVFTGSTRTGRSIMRAASDNLKRLTLELGGNDAGIILDDIDVKAMAPRIFNAVFHNNGQTCAALKRLYVHESIYDELSAELAEMAKNVVVGDGLEEGTELGPVQNKAQLDIVMGLADDARAAGGTFIAGGKRMDRPGYFFEPTLVTGLTDGSRLVDEEPFGPIAPIIKYSDVEDVLSRANASDNGLSGSIWSGNPERATELAKRLECGFACVNEHGAIQPDAPFGGVKQSGFGVEFGRYGLEEFTSIQTVKIMK